MELGKKQIIQIAAGLAGLWLLASALGQAVPATITGFSYTDTNGVKTSWTTNVLTANPSRAQVAELPPLPITQIWRVTCPYCSTTFNTGAVFDRVNGGTSNPDGSTIEHHQMRCNCGACSKQITWNRDVLLPKVVAFPIN